MSSQSTMTGHGMVDLLQPNLNLELELLRRTIAADTEHDPGFADAVRYAAIPRRLNEEVIGALRDRPGEAERNREIVAFLRRFPYTRVRADGDCAIQQGPRALLIGEWLEDPERREEFDEYNRRVSSYYRKKHEALRGYVSDLALAEPVLRRANPERYHAIARRLDTLEIEPLLEALYHEVMLSASDGYSFFTTHFAVYERDDRSTVCETLMLAAKDYLRQHPRADERSGWDRWFDYWEGRLANLQRRHQEAAEMLGALRERTGSDTKLALWTLNELGSALRAQDRLVEARAVNQEGVTLAEETGVDRFNLPVYYEQLAGSQESLGELDLAAEAFRQAIRTAREVGNGDIEVTSRLNLSRVLALRGRYEESLVVVVEALDRWRSGSPTGSRVCAELLKNLMPRVHRDPALLDTLHDEGVNVLAANRDTELRLAFDLDYVDALRESGRLARAEAQLGALKERASGLVSPSFLSTVFLSEGILHDEAGRLEEAIVAHSVASQLARSEVGVGWNEVAALSNRGLIRREQGRWEEALEDLRGARERWERIGHRRYVATVDVFEAGVHERRHRATALHQAPDDGGDALGKFRRAGDLLRLQGDPGGAERQYERLVAADDEEGAETGRAWLRRSALAGMRGDWAAAAAHAAAACRAWEDRRLTAPAARSVPVAPGVDLDIARRLLDDAALHLDEQFPERLANLLHDRARVLQDEGRLEEARDQLARAHDLYLALNRHRDAAYVLCDLAEAEAEIGSWEGARARVALVEELWLRLARSAAYDAVAAEPGADLANARGMLALQETGNERPEKLRLARDLFHEAAQLRPTAFWYRLNYAYAAHQLESWRDAAEGLEEALRLAPAWFPGAVLHRRLIDWHLHCGHLSVVEGASGRSLEHYRRAQALLGRARPLPGAEEELPPELWLDVGDGLLKVGQLDEAQRWYEQYLRRIDDESRRYLRARILARIGMIESRRGRLAAALSPLREAFRLAMEAEEGSDELVRDVGSLAIDEGTFRSLAEPLRLLAGFADADPETRRALSRAQLALSRDRYAAAVLGWGPTDVATRCWSALMVTPIILEIAASLVPPGEEWVESHPLFSSYLPDLRERTAAETGVVLPGIRVRADANLEDGAFRVLLDEGLLASGSVVPGRFYRPASGPSPDAAPGEDPDPIPALDPLTFRPDGAWVVDPGGEEGGGGAPLWDHLEYMVRFLESHLRLRLHDFFGIDDLERRLADWVAGAESTEAASRRALVASAAPDLEARLALARVVRMLLRESVPVVDLGPLLRSFAEARSADLVTAAEEARFAVRDRIPAAMPRRTFFGLAPAVEAELAASVLTHDGKRYLSVEPGWAEDFHDAVEAALAGHDPGEVTVVASRAELRPYLRTFLEETGQHQRVGVVAARELGPEIDLSGAPTIAADHEPGGAA